MRLNLDIILVDEFFKKIFFKKNYSKRKKMYVNFS